MENNNSGINTEWQDKVILIAEDVEVNFLLIKAVVERTKAKVIWAQNGQEAIDYVKNNEKIDLILMDIMMPHVDGFEAAIAIKAFRPNLPIIAQTAFGNDIDQDKLKNASFDGFLTKPIKLDELAKILNKFFNK
jgi:two-component system, cell cycle response regulator DivK